MGVFVIKFEKKMTRYSVLIIGGIVFQVELHLRAIGLLGAGHGSSAAADLVVEPYQFIEKPEDSNESWFSWFV